MMNLSTAISQATRHLLKSEKARTFRGETLEIERHEEVPEWLVVTTWGYDYETIKVPENRQELIGLKVKAQIAPFNDSIAQVAKRYYLDILRREAA